MGAAASRFTMALVLGWSCLVSVHAQQGSEVAIDSLQQERKRLRELPLDESLDQRLDALATPLDLEPASAVRLQIAAFDARLSKSDKLRPGQTERLTELLNEIRSLKLPPNRAPATLTPMPPQLYQVWLQHQAIADRERALREREAQADLILERLPRLLNGRQVRIYAQLAAAGLNRLRAEIRDLRRQAGLLEEEVADLPLPAPKVPPPL